MFDLTHASLEVRKAAALQGVRSGEVEFISSPGPGNTEAEIVAYAHNRQGSMQLQPVMWKKPPNTPGKKSIQCSAPNVQPFIGGTKSKG